MKHYTMQNLSNKETARTTADSYATLFGSRSSLWFSTKQPQQSVDTELENTAGHHHHVKLSEAQYQEQDSSSTLSSEKSHHESATSVRSNFHVQNISFQPGSFENYKKKGDDYVSPSLPKADCGSHQVQMEHNPSLATISYPLAGSYLSRITVAYEPNATVYPVGIEPARIVLPLDYAEGIPIYVNARQYHAILRRRQTRAKLEAQNKLPKSRKPYLHESRHRHALKRARGSGGRFLNTKNTQQKKTSPQTYDKSLSLRSTSEAEIQHSESNSWGTSTTSGSDVSCIFNNDDIFHQPNLRVSISSLSMGPTTPIGAHSRRISIDRCARISSVT
ncbi:hypothetical protein CDL12_03304 [Handroanthus impetiginosus]|uniref:Nuclear transcription factor Y subunit n=1 Tax=Handroanthus impetiginosus TaxID=429701 RepID=A0A2G9I2K7_9LAMI|nr:hypothetical protein CDL12_03304 [Handroanthus impetiginosus]